MIKYSGVVTTDPVSVGAVRSAEKHAKRAESLKKFHKEIGEKARENEKRAAKSLEYARHAIVK